MKLKVVAVAQASEVDGLILPSKRFDAISVLSAAINDFVLFVIGMQVDSNTQD